MISKPVYHERQPGNFVELESFAIPCSITADTFANSPSGTAGDCAPGTRHFGDLRRNSLRGPQFKQWDIALHKDTALTEHINMQLRAEFFNVINHANFANPFLPAFIADPGIGGFQSANGREVGNGGFPRFATGDVGIGNPFLGGGAPRGIQLAAKFRFGVH
ncbi:hypothetical protein [Occallatibacter riparius]